MAPHIMLLDADTVWARVLELELNQDTYQVTHCQDGLSGLLTIRQTNPDLVILNWALRGLSALDICRRLRLTGSSIPILLMDEQHTTDHCVSGLDAGANDYIAKSIHLEELLARVRSHLHHALQGHDPQILQFHDLKLNLKMREVYRGDRLIDLTAKEFDLLAYLVSHPRQVITRDQILERVWDGDFYGSSNIIEVYVGYLRRKLEAKGEARLIQTVRGIGYVLKQVPAEVWAMSA